MSQFGFQNHTISSGNLLGHSNPQNSDVTQNFDGRHDSTTTKPPVSPMVLDLPLYDNVPLESILCSHLSRRRSRVQ